MNRENRCVHPCPCCGFKTLPSRADYELCPVCWWEDDGGEPWEVSGPNGITLIEGQQQFLALRRPYRWRPGKVRAPRKREARDPGWRPFVVTPEIRARMDASYARERRSMEEADRRAAEELARDPAGPFAAYNAEIEMLRNEAASLSNAEVEERLRGLLLKHGMRFPQAETELLSRLLRDEHYYRRHPHQGAWWLIRYARPGTLRLHWRELRTGTFTFAG